MICIFDRCSVLDDRCGSGGDGNFRARAKHRAELGDAAGNATSKYKSSCAQPELALKSKHRDDNERHGSAERKSFARLR
jgi:hypothetical protein